MALWYNIPEYAPSKIWYSSIKLSDEYVEWTIPWSAGESPAYGRDVHVTGEAIPVKLELPEDCSYMFAGCTSINPALFITKNVTNMRGLFEDSLVTSVDLSSWDTSNVTNMSYMFANTSLTSINLTGWDTSKVTNMGAMFLGFRGTTLDISSFKTPELVTTAQMFMNCTNLTTIYTWGFTNTQITTSPDMFTGSTNLVGEHNTVYSSSNVGKTYARVDNPPTEPGYFTAKYHWIEHIPYIKVDGFWVVCDVYI